MITNELWSHSMKIMSDYEINDPYCMAGRTFFHSHYRSKFYANILSIYIFVNIVSDLSFFFITISFYIIFYEHPYLIQGFFRFILEIYTS
jgi:hypothetical protein